jgi:aryl carrier-like protein
VRGFRIELEEIEARLVEFEGVKEAVVVARQEAGGEKRLVAYYTVASEAESEFESDAEAHEITADQLRGYLSSQLPEFMVPAAYVRLEKLPLTVNGKLDRKALPAPEGEAYGTRSYEAPEGEIEQAIAGLWMELLKVEKVGRQDNFFALGGHSLLAIKVIERMRSVGLQVDVRSLFAAPTLAGLAAAVRGEAGGSQRIEIPENRIPAGCPAITPEMLPLVELTEEEIERIVSTVPGGAGNVQDIYPLAPLQE